MNEKKNYIIAVCVVFGIIYLFCSYNNGAGIDAIRNAITDSKKLNTDMSTGIGNAQQSADSITEQIAGSRAELGNAQETIKRIDEHLKRAENSIEQSQSIIHRIRERTKKENE